MNGQVSVVAGWRGKLGALARRAARHVPRPARPAVLMYHRIASDSFDPWGLAVSPERFARQIEWLRQARMVLPLEEFARLLTERRLPRRAVAITFDDAYAGTLRKAAPLLNEGVPATVFLAIGLARNPKPFWWDALGRLVLDCTAREILIDGERIPVPDPCEADEVWPAGAPTTPRQQLYLNLWSKLRPREPEEIDRIIEAARVDCRLSSAPLQDYVPMSSDELRELASESVSLGSHAVSHRPLTGLSPADQWREISESLRLCTELTGRTPRTFAYPFGDFDGETAAMVRDAGFEGACTTEWGFATQGTSPFMIPRIQVGEWEPERLARVLAGR